METDNESWLIEEGSRIIEKKSNHNFASLTELEKAIYCLWVIDYSVRNSGTLEPMREIHETSITELIEFANINFCNNLYSILTITDEKILCDNYLENFDKACKDLHDLSMNGK